MKFKNKIIYAVLIILLINTNYVFAEKSDSIKNEIEDNKNKIVIFGKNIKSVS